MSMIFPGMDPYLENPAVFSGIHGPMVVYLRDQLTPLIRPRYVASVGERVYVESPEQRPIGPDVWVRETRRQGGSLAVADVAVLDEPVLVDVPALEQAYESGSYRQRIDYHAPCEPPLAPDDQTWADELVRASFGVR